MLAAFIRLVDQFFRMHAVNIAHEAGFDDVVSKHVLNTLTVVAGDIRWYRQHHVFDLAQSQVAVLGRNCQSVGGDVLAPPR